MILLPPPPHLDIQHLHPKRERHRKVEIAAGDFNANAIVGIEDLQQLLANFGT